MSGRTRVLVVDDEPQIQRFLKPALTAAGYEVMSAATGHDALKIAATSAPDVVLLDLGLPDIDGKDVLKQLRSWSSTPVIVLSARDRETEKIAAFDLGADDYVNKPFGIGELLARLRASLRHAGQQAAAVETLTIGPLSVDPGARQVTKTGTNIKLTPKEFDLLHLLMRNAGRVLTQKQILTAIWGPAHVDDAQYLRVFIGRLRSKLEADPEAPHLIQTEPGIGYRMTIEGDD